MRRAAPISILTVVLLYALVRPPGAEATDRTVLHYGDSLAVGTDIYLDGLLPGWLVRSSTDLSRHAYDVPSAVRSLGSALPRVLVVSAGTNDAPGAPSRFRAVVRRTVTLAGPGRCVIWATIFRPPYLGVSYSSYNEVLRATARSLPNLVVLDWEAMARAHPGWFGADGVHPSMTGYRARAAEAARLVRRCAG